MSADPAPVSEVLGRLESHYGPQSPNWPVDPYGFLIWWHSGYPQSDDRCTKGWKSLNRSIGVHPDEILQATIASLAFALRSGGLFPEARAERVREVATRVKKEFGGDLGAHLRGPVSATRKLLTTFPGIATAGADRILLFAGLAPVPAIPSNCPHAVVRILDGADPATYPATYKRASELISLNLPESFDDRARAYLLLKRHGQELCKRSPRCVACPLNRSCRYAAANKKPATASDG